MCDTPQVASQNRSDEDHSLPVREGRDMRSVVRNMVANMESVISDLQGIMGEIQSLVVQIDTVTDKIDQQCGAQADNTCSSKTSEHCVRKPESVHGKNKSSSSVHNSLYAQEDYQITSTIQEEITHQESECLRHNVLQVKAFRRDDIIQSSALKSLDQLRPQDEKLSSNSDLRKDKRFPCSSKSFSHFSKGLTSPSGGIAIVYPTIKSTSSCHAEVFMDASKSNICTDKTALTKSSGESFYFQKNSPERGNRCDNNCQQLKAITTFQDNESRKNEQSTVKHKYGPTFVYNKFFQPVTPTELRSPSVPMTQKHVQAQASNHDPTQSSASSKDIKSYRVSYPIPEKSTIPNSPVHKYCTIGSSLSNSLQTLRESSLQYQRLIPNSPLTKRSSKAVYNTLHGSPPNSSSPSSIRRPGTTENYYYSIESDLDSEALIENIDNRTMTPDIDWSYLNLVGNDNFRCKPGRISSETLISDHAYEIPVIPAKLSQPFQMLQTSPDVISRLPPLSVNALPITDCYIDTNFIFPGPSFVGTIYNCPVIAHVFCSEVNSFKTNGYCGCYESVLDSVLENIAGFESFEEACEELDYEEGINETYVSFDDEFEEDDWDVGMKSDEGEYELSEFNIHSFVERVEALDNNRNIFDGINNTIVCNDKQFSTYTDNGGRVSVNPITERYNDSGFQKRIKRQLSPVFSDACEDITLSESPGNSFIDDDCCSIKPTITNNQQNFILLYKPFVPNDLRLFSNSCRDKLGAECDNDMSSSDDTSCQAIGTGSPMSFSSPEAVLTSPDTDRFVTSSEGDDLFTSQEEAYFHLSETHENINMPAARANMLQLRREFFESLYNVCDRRERERLQNNEQNIVPDENSYESSFSRMDNSRDTISETGSYQEDATSYNRNINTWTAYTIVHIQADDIADSTTDIFNDNNITCSMTSSYLDADNFGTAPGNDALSC